MSNISVDDLLAELDDLPGRPGQSKEQRRAAEIVKERPKASIIVSTTSSSKQTQSSILIPDDIFGAQAKPSHSLSAGPRSSLDDLFDDLGDLSPSASTSASAHGAAGAPRMAKSASGGPLKATSSSLITSPPKPLAKCMGIFLGGPNRERGRNGSTVGSVICCDHLRCTKCDFKVIWFSSKEWDDGVDYLFFRNNYPTEAKLSPKLIGVPNSYSYCCQCSWRSTTKDVVIDFGGDLRWVCGGHSIDH